MKIVIEDLRPDDLTVVYPGDQSYRLSQSVTVLPLAKPVTERQIES